jgi:hypothetical protein
MAVGAGVVKGRLFWKIFTAFCLVFFAQLAGLWALFIVLERNHPYWANNLERYAAPRLEQMAGVIISRIGPEAIPATLTQGPMPTLMIGRLAPPRPPMYAPLWRRRRHPMGVGGGYSTACPQFCGYTHNSPGFSMSAGFCRVLFSLPFWAFTYPCRSGR